MIRDYLKEHILIADGAMGTYYDQKKSENGRIAEEANLLEPELIQRIHEEYLESGAQLIRSNTFAANRSVALRKGIESKAEQDAYIRSVVQSAWNNAKVAVKRASGERFIAANIGPMPEYLFLEYDCNPTEEYQFIIECFLDCGAKIFNFETFSDITEVQKAARYIKKKCPEAFVMVSFAVNRTGYTAGGISMNRLFTEAAKTPEIDSYGCNCMIGAAHMYDLLKTQNLSDEKFVQILPNSGYQEIVRGHSAFSEGAAYYAEKMQKIAELGVNILGGCCGTTPAHIRNLSEMIADHEPWEKLHVSEKDTENAVSRTRNNPFMEKLQQGKKVIAVELDPPFDQNAQKLLEGAFRLKKSNVDIITLADSPLARARADSVLLAAKVNSMVDIPVMPHIACRDRNRISMHSTLLGAHINGIRNLMIVTGDPVPSGERGNTKSVFDFNSIRFMEYVKELNQDVFLQDSFSYGGALNQNQANTDKVIERMQKKIDAGVSWFMTQPIYSDEEVEKLARMKRELDTKILCGIMPLVSYRNAMFIKNEMPGIHVPDEIVEQYRPDMSRAEAEAVAVDISLEVIDKLKDVADGFYFMTPFNRVELIGRIIDKMEK
ncbi:bifunctional homocysteine S-methyltransferase/methylenetetrahydrofolate reductase [uncultured Eubacterium sp.]|uniref:bifunctional homocysteine S-methyltransferase/methylenetetrahydrofolate reductase n=1 Tax=uncultured Eubacterium sp. TaxID=165185 RepID=UPI0015B37B5D|nr:bifunctional homocysteine S-methyltransferase/methylenetetrahydrofolate reductase [uncultured Eubacterium sp.]